MVARVLAIARGQFYYGWVIVAIGFLVQFVLAGIQGWGLGVFLKPMSEELGWTRAMLSSVQSFSIVVGGLVAPFVGPIIDKRGGRGLMIVGAVFSGIGFMSLSFVQNLWDFYLLRGIIVTIGMSCGGFLTANVAISNWFVRNRGKAISIGTMGVSFGGMVLAPFAAYLIVVYGWRMAWVVLGAILLLLVIPPVALFMRRRPEDMGLLPDGGQGPGARRVPSGRGSGVSSGSSIPRPLPLAPCPMPHEETWTRREAMRTPALWLTILAFGFGQLGLGALLLHLYPFLTDLGLSATAAAAAVSVEATAAFFAKPLWGVLIDRYHVRACGVAAFAICAVGIAILGALSVWPALWLVYFATIFYGFAMGGQLPIQEVLWANYFGRLSLGTVRSIATPFSIVFGAGGPFFAGWSYDLFHSYQFAFVTFTITYTIATVFIFLAHPPKRTLLARRLLSV